MTDTRTPLAHFEQELLARLQDEITASDPPNVPTRSTRRRNLVLVGAAAAVVATGAAVAIPVLVGRPASTQAFAVDTEPDGLVSVEIYRFDDAAGLEQELGAAGVNAVVQYAPPGKMCQPPDYSDLGGDLPPSALSVDLTPPDAALAITVDPAAIGGSTLVITLVHAVYQPTPLVNSYLATLNPGDDVQAVPVLASGVDVGVTDDPVGPCTLVDDPRQSPTP